MKIGTNIKRLRRENNLTQEQLAEKLNVSAAAISQWELDKTLPDIALLPHLSALFDTTTDELLGLRGEASAARVQQYLAEADAHYRAFRYEDMIATMREAYDAFPANLAVLDKYAFALYETIDPEQPAAERMALCISLNEQILDRSLDDKQRYRAIVRQCKCYRAMGERENALLYAKKLPQGFHFCAPYVIHRQGLLPDDEKIPYNQEAITSLAWIFGEFADDIVDPNGRNPACPYSHAEKIRMLEQKIAVISAIFGEHLCDKHEDVYETHRIIAILYIQMGENERTLDHLEQAAFHAEQFATSYGEGDAYTAPLLAGLEARSQSDWKDGAESAKLDFYHRLRSHGFYDPLRAYPRFVALIERMKP